MVIVELACSRQDVPRLPTTITVTGLQGGYGALGGVVTGDGLGVLLHSAPGIGLRRALVSLVVPCVSQCLGP